MRKQKVVPFLLVCVLFWGLSTGENFAFRLQQTDPANAYLADELPPTDSPPFDHWDLREFAGCVVPYSINVSGTPDVGDAGGGNGGEFAAIDASFDAWQNVDPAIIAFTRTPHTTALAAIALDQANLLFWDENIAAPDPWDAQMDPWTAALTANFMDANTGRMFEADIIFNGENFLWSTTQQSVTGEVTSGNAQPFALVAGRTLIVSVNGGANQTVTFKAADFANIGAATAAEVAAVLTRDIAGATANAVGGKVRLVADTQGDAIQVVGGTANPTLAFDTNRYEGIGDVQTIATHENGHLIGLFHSEFAGAVMEADMRNGLHRVLQADDWDGCNFLYTPDLGDAPDPYIGTFNQYPSKVHWIDTSSVSRILNGVCLFLPGKGAEHLFGFYAHPDNANPVDRGHWEDQDHNGIPETIVGPPDGKPDYQFEWLGPRLDDSPLECESRQIDEDDFDDGVEFWAGFKPGVPTRVTIRIETTGLAGRYVSGNANKRLYLHGWFDWSDNGVWEDPGELELWWIGVPGTTDAISANWVRQFWDGDDIELDFDITPAAVPETTLWVWTRFRLDYGEDCGVVANTDGTLDDTKGAAQFGEVEDYWYGIWWWPDFDFIVNPTLAVLIGNTGNMGHQTDSGGFYLIEDQVNLLREGSPIVGFVNPDNDTLVGRYIYDDYCLLPATELEVDTFPDLKTIVASTEFWPVQIFVPMTQQHWPWLRAKMQDHIFYSENEARPDKSEQYLALKILKLFCDEPPEWWPEVTAPDSIPEAYVGMLLDIVCPSDSGFSNYPGYDGSRRMAYLQGYGGYNENYLMGIAQRDTCYEYAAGQFMCWPNPSTLAQPDLPYAMHLLRNDNFVYPQGGYDDDSLYVYMSTPGYSVYGDGSPEDYTILATGDDYDTDILEPIYIFSLAYAVVVSDDGIYELNDRVDMIMCGNVDRDPTVGLADVVYYINYLFKAGPEPWLYMADVDGNCGVGLSDVVYLITYLFKAGSPPRCSCLR